MSVADLFSVDSEQPGVMWRWRRRLWQWKEEMLAECRALLLDVLLFPNDHSGATTDAELVWHKQVPLKISVFALRFLQDRLLTKTNLIARRVLSNDMSLCVAGCGHPETAQHLFLLCNTFGSLWHMVRGWIGCSGVDADNLSDHFLQFTYLTGGAKSRRSFMQLIWLLCAWVVWNERNNRLFNNVITLISRLLDKVKMLSLTWLKAKKATFVFGTQQWWSCPLVCLGIG
ncbi:uncharacterized protein [Medicago truncatula]|uniref:uncharacterized protein n=1 Tax=Medicago truncatula TaxID=3880 RepID=UPI000D2F3477|nr:uncharacterized protein LOC112420946 [Medicago truncatula]